MSSIWPPPQWVQVLLTVLGVALSVGATVHVLLSKKDTRASIGWIGLIWLSPFLGTAVYVLLGVNRIERKARSLMNRRPKIGKLAVEEGGGAKLDELLGERDAHLKPLATLVGNVTGAPLLDGNRVEPLDGGDAAYPAMIRAIDGAERTVTLLTYIFRNDRAGAPIAEALSRAKQRGVEVRVLIDALGSVHEGSPIVRHLRGLGLDVALFLTTLRPSWLRYANLRNHRKVLVVDGRVGFTGGMNLLDDFTEAGAEDGEPPRRDLHFEVRGPVVAALQHAFADDWAFSTDEVLAGDAWFPADPGVEGRTACRLIADGPDDSTDPLAAVLLGALSLARRSVSIVTPYFIPEPPLQAALCVASMRGVDVDILLPESNNHRIVKWAGLPLLEPLLGAGCRVWLTGPTFDHTKLMIVDDAWSLLGSANWDPRSMSLNFELDVECYDPDLASSLATLVASRREGAHPLTIDELRGRSVALKLRDNAARLCSPFL